MTALGKSEEVEVLVIGGGNAAMSAAISAREIGAGVTVLEAAPNVFRGGNSRHTRNFRCMHCEPLGVLKGQYVEDEYIEDLLRVTNGKTDESLARIVIQRSEKCYHWMLDQGVHFQPALSGTLSLARTNAFFLGGGKSLLNAYYIKATKMGVQVRYNANACHLELDGDRVVYVDVEIDGRMKRYAPRSTVVASGGFQADIDWLEEAWGPAARNFLVRGTPYNRGVVLRDLLDQGVVSVGDPTQCHAVAIDGRAPKFDGGIVTRLDCVPFSIIVNKFGKRFYDEGEDIWPKRYAIWGRLIAAQPEQVGYAIIDSKSMDLFMPSLYPPAQADSIEALARQLGLPERKLMLTIDEYNGSCRKGEFTPMELDGLATKGLDPPKSNWARPISDPPYFGYELRPGVTFTYLGLKVDSNARVQGTRRPIGNLWAAGEIMAGSILGEGYLAGIGMTIGTVFGRIAGQEAAKNVV